MPRRNPNLVKDKTVKQVYWLYNRYKIYAEKKDWLWIDTNNNEMNPRYGRSLNDCSWEVEEYHKSVIAEQELDESLWAS